MKFEILYFLFFIFVIFIFVHVSDINTKNNALNQFCIDKGHSEFTDFKEVGDYFYINYIAIECDGFMYFADGWAFECIEYNKYGECLEEQRFVFY